VLDPTVDDIVRETGESHIEVALGDHNDTFDRRGRWVGYDRRHVSAGCAGPTGGAQQPYALRSPLAASTSRM
jgi:hypothetical protein